MDLLIDASLRDVRLALFEQDKCLYAGIKENGRAEDLQEMFQQGLETTATPIENIKRVLVLNGPGSFTGLRVALAFAQGLCFRGNRQLYTISSLEAWSYFLPAHREAMIFLPARKGFYYLGRYSEVQDGSRRHEHSAEVVSEADLLSALNSNAATLTLAELDIAADKKLDLNDEFPSFLTSLWHYLVPVDAKKGISPRYLAPAAATKSTKKSPMER